MRRQWLGLVSAQLLWVACGGGSTTTPHTGVVATVSVAPELPSLLVGATVQLTATPKDAEGNSVANQGITWSSSAEAVASVNSTGIVTGVSPGTSQIRAIVGSIAGQTTITVSGTPVATVTLSQTTATLVPNQLLPLTATARDAQGNVLTGRTIVWSSSASAIASVSQDGIITPASPGTATITATSENKTAQAIITVIEGGFIGAAGGTVTSTGGNATIIIPTGALTTGTAITSSLVANPPANPKLIVGTAYDFGPNGTAFAQPVTVSIKYSAANVGAATPANFRLHRFTGGAWTAVAGSTVNTTTLTVSGQTSTFSQYAVLEVAPAGPTITTLLPTSAVAASPTPLLLAISGTGFTSDAEVRWNGSARTTTFISATQLLTTITTADLATQGTAQITVANVAAGAVSSARSYTIGTATVSVAVGLGTSCGLKSDGRAFCWGSVPTSLEAGNTPSFPVPGGFFFKQINADALRQCGVATTGAAYCWGAYDVLHSFGITSQGFSTTPSQVSGGLTWSMVMTKSGAQCGLITSGAAYCWGSWAGTDGLSHSAPTAVPGVGTFVTIDVGGVTALACALTEQGKAYCWGDNSFGGIGNGTTGSAWVPNPTLVSGNLTFIAISVGGSRVCGVTVSGAAYCWGAGGGLGDGSTSNSAVPVLVAGGHVFQAVSLGGEHACGVDASGIAWCWGEGSFGRLGQGVANSTVPVMVNGGQLFRSISANGSVSCGVTVTVEVYCWGAKGGLGNSTLPEVAQTPVAVSGGMTFIDIATNLRQSCGLTAAKLTYCWGTARRGGDPISTDVAVPTLLGGGIQFASLSGGESATMCGLTVAGVAYCWGDPLYTGDNGSAYAITPTVFPGGLTWSSISPGNTNVCGISSTNIYCSGTSNYAAFSATPVAIPNGSDYTQVANEYWHLCALKTGGAVFCLGFGSNGALGNGTQTTVTTLTPISGALSFTSLTSSFNSTCGSIAGGAVYCWGTQARGVSYYVPTLISGLNFANFSLAQYAGCGVTLTNDPYCFGDFQFGPLGSVQTTSGAFPRPVTGPLLSRIVTTLDHACGLTPSGAAYCWGARGTGVIGDGSFGYVTSPVLVQW